MDADFSNCSCGRVIPCDLCGKTIDTCYADQECDDCGELKFCLECAGSDTGACRECTDKKGKQDEKTEA